MNATIDTMVDGMADVMVEVTVELVNASTDTQIPAAADFQLWATTALAALHDDKIPGTTELSIRLVDESESAQLNTQYRDKQGPTNILSFSCDAAFPGMQDIGIKLLGDLVICAPLVVQEALEQHKTPQAHWAHLTVHGVLHLSGFDHEEAAAAEQMEALEIHILDTLGFGNPYQQDEQGNE